MKIKGKFAHFVILDTDNKIIKYKPTNPIYVNGAKGAQILLKPIFTEEELIAKLPLQLVWRQIDNEGNDLDSGVCELTVDNYEQYISGDSDKSLPVVKHD